MTTFRFRWAFGLLASLLGASCEKPLPERALPHTAIGNIMRLGDVKRINEQMKRHLLGLSDFQAISAELAQSNFTDDGENAGCRRWHFDEPADEGVRNSWRGIFYYTLWVSVTACDHDLEISAAYRGL